ncbi:zf-HC2 domain-containing protein [uncultured Tyzzerella sp.]|uniref:anti-sigma factor family protein n=1 Tax=uncultured Tyzzerella sp. TaxID=2321398 RepID=UPI002943F17F|nr:zf-HC2 domain-containing protein [uncultured Tyzzerella sp.]
MDCNKVNKLMMDYMDSNISEEDNFLLQKHLEQCDECRESFELYTQILDEFSLDADYIIEAPEDFEINIMKQIEHIEPRYIKEKTKKNMVAYVFLGMTSLMFSLFLIVSLNKEVFLSKPEQYPIICRYYKFFENIFNISIDTLNITDMISLLNTILPYIIEGLKYTSIITIICIIIAHFLLRRRESLKI